MGDGVDLKMVVKHLVDGTLNESLCRICLLPLGVMCENIFTKICKEDEEYCMADVLERVCGVKVTHTDNYNICIDCFVTGSKAYKFCLLSKRSEEIINFYVDELSRNLLAIDIPEEVSSESICITLPEIVPEIKNFDYDMEGCMQEHFVEKEADTSTKTKAKQNKRKRQELTLIKQEMEDSDDDNVVVVIRENKNAKYINLKEVDITGISKASDQPTRRDPTERIRRKRDPMTYKKCSKCPVKYRFMAKLQEHMKQDHNIDLFICRVCKMMIEDEQKIKEHLKMHTNVHRCHICNMVFKKYDTIKAHLQWHNEMKNLSKTDGVYICELCGVILPNEEELRGHNEKKHDKKYTCYYCGKMYKGELSFESHIMKHEMHMKLKDKRQNPDKMDKDDRIPTNQASKKEKAKKLMCATCGRDFVDERALTWHNMLHTNERPFKCDACGKAFVSKNRRNQHALTAHTAPARRCPVCPALFHLRSMVNTHIKKVHLNAHKRRNRTSKYQNVCWKTEAVPIQELSVSIQNEILELQAKKELANSTRADHHDMCTENYIL